MVTAKVVTAIRRYAQKEMNQQETRQRSLQSHSVPGTSEPLHTIGAHKKAL